MPEHLLTTKLYIPPPRPNLVPRPHLIERLDEELRRGRKLMLVSAPAGFGKTTLLGEWAHWRASEGAGSPFAWLSLDKGDNDLARFWTYFIAALRTIEPDIGESALGALQSPQLPPIEAILTALINEVAGLSDPGGHDCPPYVLVLDDYHLIEIQPIHKSLAFLLAHLPPSIHLVIASRADPFLPLSRLRARGQVTEIRASDLRFSPAEAATFLNQAMGLALSGDQVAALEARTEGWITGLQLAALSMEDQEDAAGFISSFAGDDRYVVDYLIDEVLAHQSPETKAFLFQTSILDRMTGDLCDAVTGQEGGQNVLEDLERANLFIVPLDNRRRWYRYHRLLADLLRQRLEESATSQEDVKSLHRRAGQWYEENDFLIEAVEHRLAAGDYEDVIRLIHLGAEEMFTHSQLNSLLEWEAQLPQELVASQPRLCMICAWAWLATGHPERAERHLKTIEQALGREMSALCREEEERAEALPPTAQAALAEIAVLRAEMAIGRGDISGALRLSHLALPYLEDDAEQPYLHNPPKDSRTVVYFIMGLAHKFRGELGAADEALSDAATLGRERGNSHIVALSCGHRANVEAIQGRLRRAMQTCRQGLQWVGEMAGGRPPTSGLIEAILGNLLYEQNDLEVALRHLQEGIAVAKTWSLWDALARGYTGLARVRAARRDWKGAFAAIDELAALGQNRPEAVMPAVESFRARLWAAQGEPNAARRWAQTAGLDVDGGINPLREDEFIVLARVLMAEERWAEAAHLIARLVDVAESGERWGRVIELSILRALVLDARGKQDEALGALGRALTLAEPEGYVRVFVDEGEPMAALLRQAVSRGTAPDYAGALLVALEPGAAPKPATTTPLVEPLSERELDVLRWLRSDLSGPEIADELKIALSTLRTHTQHIYGKLNVGNRRAAVSRAEELGLI